MQPEPNAGGYDPSTKAPRRSTGIVRRHSRACRSRNGGGCNCNAGFEAWVYSARDGCKIRRTFPTHGAARSWRADAQRQVERGALRSSTATTVRESAEAWLDGARSGAILNRSGDRYKPSVIRGYEQALRLRVLKAIGAKRVSQVTTADLQLLVDRWRSDGLSPSTVRNTLLPLRAIYRRAVNRDGLPVNPTRGIDLPAVRGRRDRIVSPEQAAQMIAALPVSDQPLWAMAIYAGLRAGELLALRWRDVDLKAGVVRVERSWDKREGPIEPKSRAGKRVVPIAPQLRAHLAAHQLASLTHPDGLVFGRTTTLPFSHSAVLARARRVWTAAGLPVLGLHDARHTYASLMIAALVNAKALSTFMGHSSVTITFDRYGHLMPGSEAEAAALLDAYLSGAPPAAESVLPMLANEGSTLVNGAPTGARRS